MSEERKKAPHPFQIEIFPSGKTLSVEALAFYRESNAAMRKKYSVYRKDWDEHLKTSKRFITETAMGLNGKALILGIGNGLDIPLELLAEQFDQLTLVEIDEKSVVKAVEALPLKSQEKIRIVVDDLTGSIGKITAQLQEIARSGSFLKFLNKADSVVKTSNPSAFQIDNDYSFVCSSLILTQFASQLYDPMRRLAFRVYAGAEIKPDTGGLSLLVDLTKFAKECQSQHLNLLRRSVSEDGRVYLADTISETYLARDPLSQQMYPTSRPFEMIDTVSFARDISERFTSVQERSWTWYCERPLEATVINPTRGSLFQIHGASLKPKIK